MEVPAVVTHYSVLPSIDLYAPRRGVTWARWPRMSRASIARNAKALPRGDSVALRGEVATMNSAFIGPVSRHRRRHRAGLLLIVVNFQSWLDPFIIITALPAALAGIVWMLFVTRHHA